MVYKYKDYCHARGATRHGFLPIAPCVQILRQLVSDVNAALRSQQGSEYGSLALKVTMRANMWHWHSAPTTGTLHRHQDWHQGWHVASAPHPALAAGTFHRHLTGHCGHSYVI